MLITAIVTREPFFVTITLAKPDNAHVLGKYSYLLNPLMAAQQVAFDDTEVESDRVYKLRSPQYIKTGETFSYAHVMFGDNFTCYEWQLSLPREQYETQLGCCPVVDKSFGEIPAHETSVFNPEFIQRQVDVTKQFYSNCVLYFPANRFEQPAWLNEGNLTARRKVPATSNHQPSITTDHHPRVAFEFHKRLAFGYCPR